MAKTCIDQLTRSEATRLDQVVETVMKHRMCPSIYRGKILKRFGRTVYSVPLGRRKRILFERSCRGYSLKAVLTHEQYNRFITQKR